jgi:hypothetical protein
VPKLTTYKQNGQNSFFSATAGPVLEPSSKPPETRDKYLFVLPSSFEETSNQTNHFPIASLALDAILG